jgi:DNA-binding MarR family transcriptional regulator
MDPLLDLLLSSGLRPPLFHPDLLALDRELPRSEVLALLLLQRRGEVTMSELAEDLGAPLSTATGIGTRLARRGLVERQRQPHDRRVIRVGLTRKGQATARKVRAHVDALLGRVQAALSAEEIAQLIGLVTKVARAFHAPAPPAPDAPAGGSRQIPIEE